MKLGLHSVAGALALIALPLVAGCAAYLTVDGYDANYAEAPREYERYPHYEYRGVQVYEVNGRYYRQYNRRWVVYRERPRDLRHDEHHRR